MSYILEALKQAEEERGSERLTKTLAVPQTDHDKQSSIDWKKWLTIAIFINAVVLFVWVAWQLVTISTDTEINEQLVHTDPVQAPAVESKTEKNASLFTNSTNAIQEKIAPKQMQQQEERKAVQAKPNIQVKPQVLVSTPEVTKQERSMAPAANEKVLQPEHAEVTAIDLIKDEHSTIPSIEQVEAKVPRVAEPEVNIAKVEPLPPIPQEDMAIENEKPVKEIKVEPIEPTVPEKVVIAPRPQVPEYAELPYSLQQKIPEIRISVHIYNSDPELRKVRVNGQIFWQGEEVDRNLIIEEITPRGVVFNYADTMFRLNLH